MDRCPACLARCGVGFGLLELGKNRFRGGRAFGVSLRLSRGRVGLPHMASLTPTCIHTTLHQSRTKKVQLLSASETCLLVLIVFTLHPSIHAMRWYHLLYTTSIANPTRSRLRKSDRHWAPFRSFRGGGCQKSILFPAFPTQAQSVKNKRSKQGWADEPKGSFSKLRICVRSHFVNPPTYTTSRLQGGVGSADLRNTNLTLGAHTSNIGA